MSGTTQDPPKAEQSAPPVVVKKYANRRLYNTESSSYITLENLAEMIRSGRDFVVYDAKTNEDITRQVLTQIIVEEEGKGAAMLPTSFLRQLIGFYGEDMQGLVPRYLEQAMDAFSRQQSQMRTAMQEAMTKFGVPSAATTFPQTMALEEISRQNMAMMERAMSLFAPFARREDGSPAAAPDVEVLKAEVEALRGELARLRAARQKS
jgi:polyhydroxyalkanoate synthesis repressor PhaR